MRRFIHLHVHHLDLYLAAALVLSVTGQAGCSRWQAGAQSNSRSGDRRSVAMDRNEGRPKPISADVADLEARRALVAVTEAAVTVDGINDVVAQFTKADRQRIGTLDTETSADLNAAVGEFLKHWKDVYGEDFQVKGKEQLVFAEPVEIQPTNEVGEARLAGEKIPAEYAPLLPDGPEKAAAMTSNESMTVTLPASAGAPRVMVHLHNEGEVTPAFKIEAPQMLDGERLKANLTACFNELSAMKEPWSSDVNEASRMVAQHVLAAIEDAK
jgi:hypothetical protein